MPYNPWLLLYFKCHLNVEIAGSVHVVAYLYKYLFKGNGRRDFKQRPANAADDEGEDEVATFKTGRKMCANEAFWKLRGYAMYMHQPAVVSVGVHTNPHTQARDSSDSSKGNDGSSIFTRYAMRSWQVDQVIFEDGVPYDWTYEELKPLLAAHTTSPINPSPSPTPSKPYRRPQPLSDPKATSQPPKCAALPTVVRPTRSATYRNGRG